MPNKSRITDALTMPHVYGKVMNTGADNRFELTYAFAGNTQPSDSLWDYSGWEAYNSIQKKIVSDALAEIETFLNVEFNKVRGVRDPDIDFGRAYLGANAGEAGGYVSGRDQWDGQVMYDTSLNFSSQWGKHVVVHEIGHSLGLDHPFENDTLPAAYENGHYTVMSYDKDPESGDYNTSMMLYDILALQQIWGAAENRTGNTTYTGRGDHEVRVIWDTGGNDKLDASAHKNGVVLDLNDGAFSSFGKYEDVAIAFGVAIETAIGGKGKDKLFGNEFGNELRGNDSGDRIFGGKGKDKLLGNNGNDTLRGGHGDDRLNGGQGNDLLNGDGGRDLLWGKGGADTFRFTDGGGKDVVKDFEDDRDVLQIAGHGGRAAVLDAAENIHDDVKFDFGGGDVLLVQNITLAELKDDLVIG